MQYMLIDGNNIGYAAQHAGALEARKIEVQAIFGVLQTLRKLKKKFPEYKPVMLYDGKAKFRTDIYPQYKGNRNIDKAMEAARESYMIQLPIILDALSFLGVTTIKNDLLEADDLAGILSRAGTKRDTRTMLVSRDGDWLQLIDSHVSVHNPFEDTTTSEKNFVEVTGYVDGEAFLQAKAMHGDSSDNIPPIGGFGKGTTPKWMIKHGSVENFLIKHHKGILTEKLTAAEVRLINNIAPPYKIRTAKGHEGEVITYERTQDAFSRNFALMNLLTDPPKVAANTLRINREKDLAAFERLCNEFSFASILREIDQWAIEFD